MPHTTTKSDTPVKFGPTFSGGKRFHDAGGREWRADNPVHPLIRVSPEYVALRASRRRVGATRGKMLGHAPERLFAVRPNPLARKDFPAAISEGSKGVDQGGFVAGGPQHLRTRPGYKFQPGKAAMAAKPMEERKAPVRSGPLPKKELPASPKYATSRFVARLTKLPYMNRLTRVDAGKAAIGKVLPSSPLPGEVARGRVRRV